MRELADQGCKLSARSKEWYDVQKLASRFGGGGHARAAGASLNGNMAEASAALIAAVEEDFSSDEGVRG